MALPVTITGLSTIIAPVGPFKSSVIAPVASLTSGSTSTLWGADTSNEQRAQEIQAPTTGPLSSIQFKMGKTGAPTDNVWVEVRASIGSTYPTGGTVLATSNSVLGSTFPSSASNDWITFTFPTQPTLLAGNKYVFTLCRETLNASNYYGISGDNASAYAAGVSWFKNSGAWGAASTTLDWNFLAYYADSVPQESYYFFGRDGTTATTLRAFKSTAPDTSWTAGATRTGFTTAILGLNAYQVGTVIHFAVMFGTVPTAVGHMYVTYNTVTDTFVLLETIAGQQAVTGQIAGANAGSSIVVRSTGEVVAFFNGVQTKTSGTFRARVYHSRRLTTGAWQTAVQVDSNTAADNNFPIAVLGAADRVHFAWAAGPNTSYRTLSAANALNNAGVTASMATPGDGVSYDRSGTTKVVITNTGTGQVTLRFDSSDNPTPSIFNHVINAATTPHRIGADPDTKDVSIIYRSSADSDLYVIKSTDDGATFGSPVLFFAGTIPNTDAAASRSATGSVYTRGSSVVVGYVVNDNGTWKYNEYTVRVLTQVDAWSSDDKTANIALTDADKTATTTSGTAAGVHSTTSHLQGSAGKFYAEILVGTRTANAQYGTQRTSENEASGLSYGTSVAAITGDIYRSNVVVGNVGGALNTGDVLNLAWDSASRLIWFRKNSGLWNNSAAADPATGIGGIDVSGQGDVDHSLWFQSPISGTSATVRTGFVDFQYQHPAGYSSWMGEIAQVDEAWHVGDKTAGVALSDGDKTATATSSIGGVRSTTRRSAGKYYAEFHLKAGSPALGLKDTASSLTAQSTQTVYVWPVDGNVIINGTNEPVGLGALVANDILSVAWDDTAKLIWFRKNAGEWNPDRSGNPEAGTGGLDLSADITGSPLAVWFGVNGTGNSVTLRTEKDEFTQTTPGGYLSWMGETLVLLPVEGTGALVAQNAGLVSNFALSGSVGTGALVAVPSGRTNYTKYSEELNRAGSWNSNGVTSIADAIAAPNATLTAETFTTTSTDTSHYCYATPNIAGLPAGTYTASVYAKAGTGQWLQITDIPFANFDLINGVVGSIGGGVTSTSVTPVGDGWYRCSLSYTKGTGAIRSQFFLLNGDTPSSAPSHATGGLSVHLWGAQYEAGPLSAYIPTLASAVTVGQVIVGTGTAAWNATGALVAGAIVTNLVKQSQTLNLAPWTTNATTITADSVAAPDTTLTAERLNDNATNNNHYALQSSIPTILSTVYTLSIYAKAGTLSWLRVIANFASQHWANFNLATGQLGQKAAGVITQRIEALPDGWYRCSITANTGGTSSSGLIISLDVGDTTWPTPYVGGSGNLYVWGAQFEFGSQPTAYIPTTTASVTVGNAPALTGTGEVTTPPAIGTGVLTSSITALVSNGVVASVGTGAFIPSPPPGRANIILQSQALEVAPWGLSAAIISADAALAPDLTTTAERVADTAASGSHVFWQSVTNEAAVYTYSFYAKAGTLERIRLSIAGAAGSGRADFNLSTGEVTQITSLVSAGATAVGDGWWRCHVTRNPGAGTGTFYAWLLDAAGNSSYVGTGKDLYLWGAQLEKGDAPSGYLPTTTTPASVPGQTLVGVGVSQVVATGALAASIATLASSGLSESRSTSTALVPLPSSILASGQTASSGTGALTSIATLVGFGTGGLAEGPGVLVAGSASLAGDDAPGTKVYLRPDGDVALSGWTDQAEGTTNIVQAIDEALASDDLDYVQAPPAAPSSGVIIIGSTVASGNIFGHSNQQRLMQTFTAEGEGISSIKLRFTKNGNPSHNVPLKIYTVDANRNPLTLLATSDNVIAGTSIPAVPTFVDFTFTFAAAVPVVPGVEYAFELSRLGANSFAAYYLAMATLAGGSSYGGRSAYIGNPVTWTPHPEGSDVVADITHVSGGATLLRVRLMQGATQIAEWTHAATDIFTDAEQVLTAPQVAAITDFTNLSVELDNNGGNVYRFGLGDPPARLSSPVKVKYRYKKLAA